jgi:hypothetical protein
MGMAMGSNVYMYNKSVIDRAQEGDLLEFPRGVYSHWAVYIGMA